MIIYIVITNDKTFSFFFKNTTEEGFFDNPVKADSNKYWHFFRASTEIAEPISSKRLEIIC